MAWTMPKMSNWGKVRRKTPNRSLSAARTPFLQRNDSFGTIEVNTSLIRFSNYAYYDEELIVFPAPHDDAGRLGIKFHHIADGRYKAGARVNEFEAETVARAALDHLLHDASQSLLVATFNKPQQDLISRWLKNSRRSQRRYLRFWKKLGNTRKSHSL